MKGNHKTECECGGPVEVRDRSTGAQCGRCFELNRQVMSWHEKTRESVILNAEQWLDSQERKRLNSFLRRRNQRRELEAA